MSGAATTVLAPPEFVVAVAWSCSRAVGDLVARVSSSGHGRVVTSLRTTLMATAPAGFEIEQEMTIRLDERNRWTVSPGSATR
ncbi:hypothetical protein ACWDDN_39095 [Streptomyces griseoruber]|uniref:hypothetical protein n=1 Tax=Streptomyces griseoruber TaxID=1943 RepID=UPI0037B16746